MALPCKGGARAGVEAGDAHRLPVQKETKRPEQGGSGGLPQAPPDEVDQAPQPSEPVFIQRRSPLIRNRKTGSMEVAPREGQAGRMEGEERPWGRGGFLAPQAPLGGRA